MNYAWETTSDDVKTVLERKQMYKATYNLECSGTFDTFKEAFKAIYDRLNFDIAEGVGLTYQLLESTVWIEEIKTPVITLPTFFLLRCKR